MRLGKNKLRHILTYILAAVMLLSVIPSIPASAKGSEDTTKPKVINVIYDDSGSMAMNHLTRWCEAKYALEVFTAMMGEKDTINIYQMSEFDPGGSQKVLTIKGSDGNRVKTVHDMNSEYGDTPIEPIDAAAEDLKKVSEGSNERWLVVLTDGAEFYENGANLGPAVTKDKLTEKLNGYADDFKVVYLGIGSAAASNPLQKTAMNFFPYTASDTNNEILTKVTDIANLIFEHLVLEDSYISGGYSLNIDIPTTQIIVFAQGENVSIGKLKLKGKDINGESISVKYSDVTPLNYKNAAINDSLKGVVATYNASDDKPFPSGTFDIDVSGANTVQFYYKPGVKAVCTLKDSDGNPVNAKNGMIVEGEYEAEIGFIDPITGDPVNSDLLKINESNAQMLNNDKELTVPGHVTLERGNVKMTVTIDLKGNVRIFNELEYSVDAEAISISLKLDIPDSNYHAEELGENCAPIIATVIDNKTGAPITQEQWDACQLKVEDASNDKNIRWELVNKGSAVGTWEIRPSAKNDKVVKDMGGKYLFNVTANMKYDGQKVEASEGGSIVIEQYEGTALIFEADPVPEPVKLSTLDQFGGIKVTAYTVDGDGNKQIVTPEIWEALKVRKIQPTTGRMTWDIQKGSETGTYIVKPGYMWKVLKLFTHTGDVSTTLEGKAQVGPLYYEGTGVAGLKIEPLTLKEIWMLIWKYLVIAAVALFLIIGYTTKKRINTRKMKPHIALMGKNSGVKYSVSRRLLPYVPERASINCNKPNLMCPIANLQIEATGKNTFKILNVDSVLKNGVRINGEMVSKDEKDRIGRKKYRYSGFTMAPIPPPGAGNVGMFYMSNQN